jgi:GAF domain-containing protein
LESLKHQREYLPDPLVTFFQENEFHNLSLFPLYLGSNLAALLFLGTVNEETFSASMSIAITNLIEITKTSLERITALNTITDRFTELQTINAVSQTISTETNLNQLYEVIHQQVVNVMGDINFFIALYSEVDSTIEIPYMDDGDEIISVPPFPLGQGLTSIIIRTRQPLMIVEDTINRSKALGAIVTGDKPALSWLGVPIIAGRNILGAIVVQDLEQEQRFNEDDMLLLTTLAGQIAISVRNTRLMEETRRLAHHEKIVSEMSNKISQSIDIENILKTAVRELGQLPNVTDASIYLRAPRE